MNDRIARILAVIVGILLGIIFFLYLPMKGNYDQCGHVTVCEKAHATTK